MKQKKYDIYTYTRHATDVDYGWTVQVTATNAELTEWIVTRRRHGYDSEEIHTFCTTPNPPQRQITKMAKTAIRQYGMDIHSQAKEIRLKGDNQYEEVDDDYLSEEERLKYYKLFAKDEK